MELFTISGAGGIIEKCVDGVDCILIQDRFKEDAPHQFSITGKVIGETIYEQD